MGEKPRILRIVVITLARKPCRMRRSDSHDVFTLTINQHCFEERVYSQGSKFCKAQTCIYQTILRKLAHPGCSYATHQGCSYASRLQLRIKDAATHQGCRYASRLQLYKHAVQAHFWTTSNVPLSKDSHTRALLHAAMHPNGHHSFLADEAFSTP